MEGSRRVSHDQNFKNLIIDYPLQAIQLFSPEEAGNLGSDVRVVPLRQEQLKERLGERFRELDVPLLVEWPNGQREALLFVLEEETDPNRFSIHRLAHYCIDLADLCQTTRVVPVVIFLNFDIYSALDDNERAQYKAEYPQEDQTMASLTERLRAEGMEKGIEQGMAQGERAVLSRLLKRRFGPLDAQTLNRLEVANQQQLELWAERILDADSLADVFQEH